MEFKPVSFRNTRAKATTRHNWRNKLLTLCGAFLVSAMAYADNTYMRCYYWDPSNSEVDNVWALNERNSDRYPLPGFWQSQGSLVANIFYTNISDRSLRMRCEDTLKRKGINGSFVMYAAADTVFSYNYLVWNVDTGRDTTITDVPDEINRIVSFGDSLSDTNNFFNGMHWLNTPSKKTYYGGRFSNGKNWLDYFSEYVQLPVYNWAIGGAGTVDYNLLTGGTGYWPNDGQVIKVNGVRSQVDSWLAYMHASFIDQQGVKLNHFYEPKNTLFTMLVGGNDVLQFGTPVKEMIAQERAALISLINYGAKHILLSTLPDLSHAPLFSIRKLDKNEPKSDPEKVEQHIKDFNVALIGLANELRKEYGDMINIHVFDAFALFTDLLNSSDSYGITNTKNSCLEIAEETINTYYNEGKIAPSCVGLPNKAESFVYWDLMHPTTHTHKIVAGKVVCFIKDKFPIKLTPSMEASLSNCDSDRSTAANF
jgi:thermolabile hemolysin